MVSADIDRLIEYALVHLELPRGDTVYARNKLISILGFGDYRQGSCCVDDILTVQSPKTLYEPLVEYAVMNGYDGSTDGLINGIMDAVSLPPSAICQRFEALKKTDPSAAMDWLYDYCVHNDYVKSDSIAKNIVWTAVSDKGTLEITVNLTKPEKSNKDIAAQSKMKPSGYPLCVICYENQGYAGVAKQNLRAVDLMLDGEAWFWQYSPYAYFYKHGIAVNKRHTPMKIDRSAVRKLLDFVDEFPAFFLGSNAALPRIGGSLLMHDHFQGGEHLLPMQKAPVKCRLKSKLPSVAVSVVDWYNSVIRLEGDRDGVELLAGDIIEAWEVHSDGRFDIIAETDERHNSLSPIARKTGDGYTLDMIFRNNRCDNVYPDGIFHAHTEYHNIKSEGIGLIEAMGLFVLPARLDRQLKAIEGYLGGDDTPFSADMAIHADFVRRLEDKFGRSNSPETARQIVRNAVNEVCECILYNTAVYKPNDPTAQAAFIEFIQSVTA